MNQQLHIWIVIVLHLQAVFILQDVLLIMIVPIKKPKAPEVVKEIKRINVETVQVIDHDRDQDRVIAKELVKTVTNHRNIIIVVLVRMKQIKNHLPKNPKEVADHDQDLQRHGDLKNDVIKIINNIKANYNDFLL